MEDPVVRTILEKYLALEPLLDERRKRIWAGTEARALGRGGVTRVMEATGMSRQRVTTGVKEVEAGGVRATGRVRAAGGGRKRLADLDPRLAADLERLVDPATRGARRSVGDGKGAMAATASCIFTRWPSEICLIAEGSTDSWARAGC